MKNKLYFGDTLLQSKSEAVSLETVMIHNESYFKIENYNQMDPFFMTIVSDVDFWMFISSTGGLTAGRKNPDNALLPYYTDDKIHDSCETTGSHSIFIINKEDKRYLWTPFSKHNGDAYKKTRNLYKNTLGNKIMFEEVNHDLNVTYRYTWKTSNAYGIVRHSELVNTSDKKVTISVLDGIRNILPYGVNKLLQTTKSTLVDGYKRSELIEKSGLGLFTLSSIISDKAEPSESLKSTTVWSKGLTNPTYCLSEQQVPSFLRGENLTTEYDVKGRRGAFYVSSTFDLLGNTSKDWYIVSELNQSATDVEALMKKINSEAGLIEAVETDVIKGDENLKRLVFEADGHQMTAHKNVAYRHFSNTLYNIMRGGIYSEGYAIDTHDLTQFIKQWNNEVYKKHEDYLNTLEKVMHYKVLLDMINTLDDSDLERLVLEYLPLTYSRRHGDPSRPWNNFSIEIFKENGDKNLNFEGNWRDIFQNWEALTLSYPAYIEGIISKFANASTADGYNPYRITKEGIDWEVIDHEDPWSNIGYWGDHQVIYLLKLMELSKKYDQKKLIRLLTKEIFVYANVPYRIKGFDDILKNPRTTILYDDTCEDLITKKVQEIGSDGKLIFVQDELYHVNLMEKLLVILLSKLSNFIPEGGIWLNTQRPEWNDANNALVGNGISMVTLYYLYRYISFMADMMDDIQEPIMISVAVYDMFEKTSKVFEDHAACMGAPITDETRFKIVALLGRIGETYRHDIYTNGFSGEKKQLSVKQLKDFIEITKSYLADSIQKNKREDGLYNAYNLVSFKDNACTISYLYEMLEGQVAVLSSKALDGKEALNVLEALKESAIYREDQDSYMLYPNRDLPKFLRKNSVPEEIIHQSHVLKTEVKKGLTRFIEKDVNGDYHFNGHYRNGEELTSDVMKTGVYSSEDAIEVGEIFADLFDHHAFTGRSGTFYKYEGLGCIYWHMVSKLVLAAQENFDAMVSKSGYNADAEKMRTYFHALKSGVGVEKSPVNYGAFPTDAYSHTPGFAGVQQPGMTGQVKEDFISRFGELGVNIHDSEIYFEPHLLRRSEFLMENTTWILPSGTIDLEKNQMGFTMCTVPVIYNLTNEKSITICYKIGDRYTFEEVSKLNKEISQSIFNRDGKIEKIIVNLDKSNE